MTRDFLVESPTVHQQDFWEADDRVWRYLKIFDWAIILVYSAIKEHKKPSLHMKLAINLPLCDLNLNLDCIYCIVVCFSPTRPSGPSWSSS